MAWAAPKQTPPGDFSPDAGAVVLVAALFAIPAIAFGLFKRWAKGELALKTGAAIA